MRQFNLKSLLLSYEVRLVGVFILLLITYLLIANYVYAPTGYYGTQQEPRFTDPWFERSEIILKGKSLYKDVFTTTPPLSNYLIVIPSFFAKKVQYVNPWTTLVFMLFFAFFNLLSAFVLLYMGKTRAEGWEAAVFFLLNPLTFGNAILRRQDESILIFFFALSLIFALRKQHVFSSIGIGISMLVKLWGGLLIPIAFLTTRNWKYLIIPMLVFALLFAPFLLSAGEKAMFWNPSTSGGEHPFQLGGISLPTLLSRMEFLHVESFIPLLSVIFILGVLVALGWIAWKRPGILRSLAIFMVAILLLTPKLHAGYFSLLVVAVSPLLRAYKIKTPYFIMGILVLIADFLKYPLHFYGITFFIMLAVDVVLVWLGYKIIISQPTESPQTNTPMIKA
jgi:hypothetical protein